MQTIGVLGVGMIGTPWAGHYQAAGRLVGVAQGELPLLETVRACLTRAEQQGMGDDDVSSLIRLLE